MEWEKRQREQAHYYTNYAQELRNKLEAGYLAELTPYHHFIVWKTVQMEGKWKKPPFNPRTHRPASPTDPATWGSAQEALHALQSGAYNGLGFVFSEDDPFVGIDLDHCAHLNGQINAREREMMRRINSYSEYSPRDGVHLIVKANLPLTTLKRDNLEIFNRGHTMSLTLRHIPETPFTIEERQAELEALTRGLVSTPTEHSSPTVVWQAEADNKLTEVEKRLIDHWKSQPGNFKRYYEGDRRLWLGSESKVPSKSEADFVLCLMLLTRTHDNVEETKRLFHASQLYDPHKTDRISGHDPRTGRPVTYLEMTIFNALRKRRESR